MVCMAIFYVFNVYIVIILIAGVWSSAIRTLHEQPGFLYIKWYLM